MHFTTLNPFTSIIIRKGPMSHLCSQGKSLQAATGTGKACGLCVCVGFVTVGGPRPLVLIDKEIR